jgi:hypothetical protein
MDHVTVAKKENTTNTDTLKIDKNEKLTLAYSSLTAADRHLTGADWTCTAVAHYSRTQ